MALSEFNIEGKILRPNLLRSRKTLLSIPDIRISTHFRIQSFTRESRFSVTQVLDISTTVKCQDNLDTEEVCV